MKDQPISNNFLEDQMSVLVCRKKHLATDLAIIYEEAFPTSHPLRWPFVEHILLDVIRMVRSKNDLLGVERQPSERVIFRTVQTK